MVYGESIYFSLCVFLFGCVYYYFQFDLYDNRVLLVNRSSSNLVERIENTRIFILIMIAFIFLISGITEMHRTHQANLYLQRNQKLTVSLIFTPFTPDNFLLILTLVPPISK